MCALHKSQYVLPMQSYRIVMAVNYNKIYVLNEKKMFLRIDSIDNWLLILFNLKIAWMHFYENFY